MPRTKRKTTGKKAAVGGTRKVNKSAWIRDQPAGMSAKEVVDKAAGAGIKLSVAQVYTARSAAKKQGAKPAVRGPRAAKAGAGAKRGGGDEMMAFRRLVLSIGLPKAEAYLDDLKRSVGL